MSQTLLFSIGVGVFALTVVASLLYGYFTLDRIYQADAATRPAADPSTPPAAPAASPSRFSRFRSPTPEAEGPNAILDVPTP